MMDIQRSLNKLHQVFLDMAILVETQGEEIEDIEQNMANEKKFMSGGTVCLFYAKQMKNRGNKWVYLVWTVVLIILLVSLIHRIVIFLRFELKENRLGLDDLLNM
ncbi:hypothetical protein LguiA_014056 [Lonicera macranthoides]